MTCLVDVNLPKSFSLIETISCFFVKDFSDEMPDNEIWKLAIANGYTVLTRDKDFYYRAMQSKYFLKLFCLGSVIVEARNCLIISKEILLSLKGILSIINF